MVKFLPTLLTLILSASGTSLSQEPPAQLKLADLEPIEDPDRRKLVQLALETGAELKLSKYVFGSADPAQGGFDCSGSMFYLLSKLELDPPRSSSTQFDWVKEDDGLVEVPAGTTNLDAEVFKKLKPGDLVFWSGTYKPTDGRKNKITHVQLYLGREAKDKRPVMAGSSDGRSYRGNRQCGYGVFDFRLPKEGSKSRFVGFGPPPGLIKKPADHSASEPASP